MCNPNFMHHHCIHITPLLLLHALSPWKRNIIAPFCVAPRILVPNQHFLGSPAPPSTSGFALETFLRKITKVEWAYTIWYSLLSAYVTTLDHHRSSSSCKTWDLQLSSRTPWRALCWSLHHHAARSSEWHSSSQEPACAATCATFSVRRNLHQDQVGLWSGKGNPDDLPSKNPGIAQLCLCRAFI